MRTAIVGRLSRLRHRVRVRVTAAAVAVGLIAVLGGSIAFVAVLHENLQRSLLESAGQQADAVAVRLDAGIAPARAVLTGKDDVVVQVLSLRGEVLASDHPGLAPLVRTAGEERGIEVPELGDSYAVVARTLPGDRLVVVGLAEEQVDAATGTAVRLLAVAVPVAVLLLGAVVWIAVGRALAPVEVMRREAAVITSEDLHRRLPVPPGDDEIPSLATTLNRMLDRIDVSQRRQRQFVADASHELRSPLAVVRQVLEVARRHPDATSVPALAEEIQLQETRMEELVAALLLLARLDDAGALPARDVDLDDVVHAVVDRLRTDRPDVLLDRSGVVAGQVSGDPVLLGQVVGNLLANAARHAAGRVVVALTEDGGRVRLVVEDDGPGIAPADRERVFDRFTRLDDARARDAGGAGLGLAIVRDVVQVSGGWVRIERSDLGGARFVVELPAALQP